jgi:hypothetical protein
LDKLKLMTEGRGFELQGGATSEAGKKAMEEGSKDRAHITDGTDGPLLMARFPAADGVNRMDRNPGDLDPNPGFREQARAAAASSGDGSIRDLLETLMRYSPSNTFLPSSGTAAIRPSRRDFDSLTGPRGDRPSGLLLGSLHETFLVTIHFRAYRFETCRYQCLGHGGFGVSGVNSAKFIVSVTVGLSAVLLGGFAIYRYFSAGDGQVPESQAIVAPTASFAEIVKIVSPSLRTHRLAENEDILVLDFPDLISQARALNRLAVLVEKHNAPRDRVLNNAELAAFAAGSGANAETLYFGHDYRASDIARFFNLAKADGIALNPDELALRDLLISHRFLRESDAGYEPIPPGQVLVSVVQLQTDDPATPQDETVDPGLRETILHHELSHGIFFTDNAYREHCERFWYQALSIEERTLFRAFLSSAGYDPTNERIMINEMQAFLMHTPDARAFSAAHLGVSEEMLANLRHRFAKDAPPSARFGGDGAFGGVTHTQQ